MKEKSDSMPRPQNRYSALLEWVFDQNYTAGALKVPFERDEFAHGAAALGIVLPKNLGDVLYSVRYRTPMPVAVVARAPEGMEWIIRGEGIGKYAFHAVPNQVRVRPNPNLVVTKIPDATPEIIRAAALGDEQALLALVRYNRLVDIFLGVTAYSLQNHLRTTAGGLGQVEIDEIYVAIDRFGRQFIVPVQAKGGTDEIGVTQTEQDLAVCADKWPDLLARPVSAQFMPNGVIALFELTLQDSQVRVLREAHYRLTPHEDIDDEDRAMYRLAAEGSESP